MFLKRSMNRKGFGGLYRLSDDSPMIMLDVNTVKKRPESKGTVRYDIYTDEGRHVHSGLYDYGDGGLAEISAEISKEIGKDIAALIAQSDSKEFGKIYRAVRMPQEFIRTYSSMIGSVPEAVPIPTAPVPAKGRPRGKGTTEEETSVPKERTGAGRCLGCRHYHPELRAESGRCDYHTWSWPIIDIENCVAFEPKKIATGIAKKDRLMSGKELKRIIKASSFVSDTVPVNRQVVDIIDPSHSIAARMINHHSGNSMFGLSEEGEPLSVDTKEMLKDISPNKTYSFALEGHELLMKEGDGTVHRYRLSEHPQGVNIDRIKAKTDFASAASIVPEQFKRAVKRSKALRDDNIVIDIDEKDIFLNGSSDLTDKYPAVMMSADIGDTYKGKGRGIYSNDFISSIASSISSKDSPEVNISEDGLMRFSYTPAVDKGYPQSDYSVEYYIAPRKDEEFTGKDAIRGYR